MTLAEACYRITKEFPRDELFAMSNQIRRASTSIAANIAEGQARGGKKEFLRFLRIARGSLAELETLLTLSQNVGLLTREAANPTVTLADEVGRILRGLQRSIEKRIVGPAGDSPH